MNSYDIVDAVIALESSALLDTEYGDSVDAEVAKRLPAEAVKTLNGLAPDQLDDLQQRVESHMELSKQYEAALKDQPSLPLEALIKRSDEQSAQVNAIRKQAEEDAANVSADEDDDYLVHSIYADADEQIDEIYMAGVGATDYIESKLEENIEAMRSLVEKAKK